MTPQAEIIRQLSRPLEPHPTNVEQRLPRLDGIRAVLFDVYGTLLISGSGDISLTSGIAKGDAATAALEAVGASDLAASVDGDQVVATLHEVIRTRHADSPHEYPEVVIEEVWGEVLSKLGDSEVNVDSLDTRVLALQYECRVNPVWPMPGLGATLRAISGASMAMGIVSNAQAFTPTALATLAGGSLKDLGFDPRLCHWSYAHRQAKPGTFLYQQAAQSLAEQGIEPRQTLYVGNDMRNDVWPANEVGFRTALFAGDARSLRLREDDPRGKTIPADTVLTDLRQIITVLSLADG